jgi:hypothetical protein
MTDTSNDRNEVASRSMSAHGRASRMVRPTLPPIPAVQHLPLPPLWICRVDAYPWPCADIRLDLTDGFRGKTISLTLFLASQYVEALHDLYSIDPDEGAPPDPRALYERFLGWVRTERRRDR